ncbi:BCCT family transporter [Nesterenkonia natronophila]|uniref:BCCT family transporter n=1 Tax=Nesterenkonia natronophila TaxID=2174932 RepID=A0A3A4F844_9MICC|nr:BCCT family transporter [Nesterenkonia natronophila]RJN32650.1 BCCT family transporter [Nesterenkonia natronophila]
MASQPEVEKLRDWSLSDAIRGLNMWVFIPAVVIILIALAFATWWGNQFGAEAFETLNSSIVNTVGWWYVLLCTGFVVFALWAGLSKAGNIRLGRDDEKPEFAMGSWFCMLFAAGMGIGLVFWGVAEPLWHLIAPAEATADVGVDSEGNVIAGTEAANAGSAIGQSLFHWGLHAWAIYVVIGLGLAYMTFRRGRPLAVRWLLEPIFGRKLIESWVGHVIDVLAIVGTVFGVVTSLGIGTQQIAAGMGFLGWVEDPASEPLLTGLVVVIMAIATVSVITGVHKGLKWLSNFNLVAAAVLALFVVLAGPTLFLLQSIIANIGEYAVAFPQLMFETGTDYAVGAGTEESGLLGNGWSADWTIYYWGWWMSWAPFVGMFIARISRGRTIREFVLGVLLAPTAVGILWFSIFGSSGIYFQLTEGAMLVDDGEGGETVGTEASLFQLLEQLPIASITSVLAILVVTIFFITSGDSGSLVTDVLAFGGRTVTPKLTRVFWTVLIALTAIVLLAAGDDPDSSLRVLQVAAISSAAPFSIVMLLAVFAQIKLYLFEGRTAARYVRIRRHASKAAVVDTARREAGTDEGPAVQRTVLQIINEQTKTLRAMFGATSGTLGGLPPGAGSGAPEVTGKASHDLVLAVQDLPSQATYVNPETGVLSWDEKGAHRDPLRADQTFATPEFHHSYEGWEQAAEEYFDETVASGTIPAVQPEDNDNVR